MGVLDGLEPKGVFYFFEEMARIPHGSGNTQAVSDWCVDFARERALRYRQDQMGNVIIWKDGTAGYENAAPVIFQGHLDMVCVESENCPKDMNSEGLDLYTDGDNIRARGTSLGADDGIAVAIALALLDAKDIAHPPLEAIFTVEEETDMSGAAALDVTGVEGRILLNLDSEDEGIFTVGCAGGSCTRTTLPVTREAFRGEVLSITVDGLVGGHSGHAINFGRANAAILLGRALRSAQAAAGVRIVSVVGGEKDNAIARTAQAVIVTADGEAVRRALHELNETLRREYRAADPNITISVETAQSELLPMDENSTRRIVTLLHCLPNGVQEMSREMEGVVQTSLNLGILSTDDNCVKAVHCIRSCVESQKRMMVDRVRCLAESLGGTLAIEGDFPAWEYRADSPLREKMVEVYREVCGAEPIVAAFHAGVECGIFAQKLEGLDCVSYGPTMVDIHTDRERLSISSVARTWEFTVELLKRCR